MPSEEVNSFRFPKLCKVADSIFDHRKIVSANLRLVVHLPPDIKDRRNRDHCIGENERFRVPKTGQKD